MGCDDFREEDFLLDEDWEEIRKMLYEGTLEKIGCSLANCAYPERYLSNCYCVFDCSECDYSRLF